MRAPNLFLLLTAATAAIAVAQSPSDKLTVDFQAAIQKETVQGDLKSAIAMYEKIVARAAGSAANRAVAAKALLRMAQCHEKLGNAGARNAYERIVREFGDQPGVAEARTRLAALAGPASTPRLIYSDPDIDAPRPNRDGRFVAAFCKQALCLFDTVTGIRTGIVSAPEDNRIVFPYPGAA